MKIRPRITSIEFIIAMVAWLIVAKAGAAPPNIVLILADDLGFADVGCYGAPDTKTPAIDRLAAGGLKFNHFYAMAPQCTPSRVSILTGRYPQRTGGMECAIGTGNVGRYDEAEALAAEGELGLPPQLAVLAPSLKTAGYYNAVFGKWHLGYDSKFHPLDQGFDEFIGFLGGNVDYFGHFEMSDLDVYLRGREPVRRDGYLTDLITDDAVDFLNRRADEPERPFFLYLPHAAPHFPFQSPQESDAPPRTEETWMDGTRSSYVQMVESLDTGVSRIVETLHKNGQAENTLIVFTSDHGAMPPGLNHPWRGYKSTLFEGGIRVPCIVNWPVVIEQGSTSDRVGTLMDLTASFLRIAEAVPADQGSLDGVDILRQVSADEPEQPRNLYWRYRRADETWSAIRSGDLKWIRHREGDSEQQWLFDLKADPLEQHDLTHDRSVDVTRLSQQYADWESETQPMR
jgi:arylsulfatase A